MDRQTGTPGVVLTVQPSWSPGWGLGAARGELDNVRDGLEAELPKREESALRLQAAV